MALYSKHFYEGHDSDRNRPQSYMVLIVEKSQPKLWYRSLKVFSNDYFMHVFFSSNFCQDMNLTWLGYASFEMGYLKVRLEYRTIFKR